MDTDTHRKTTHRKTRAPRRWIAHAVATALLASGVACPAFAQSHFYVDAAPSAATADYAIDDLAPGDFRWNPEIAPSGPMVAVVSLPEQRIHVYRNGVRIGLSTVSTGKPGHETPTGVFPILQKRREHYSNLYDNAPMPFMQRLTWDGIALHAGRIPGRPASHGCVRLPRAFAELLFEATEKDMLVVVADYALYGPSVVTPGERVPVNYLTGLALDNTPQAPRNASPMLEPTVATLNTAVADY
jgi:hypothetical protein